MAARWTQHEKDLLISLAGKQKPELIAEIMLKSVSAIQNYARKNDISLGVDRKPFTPSEDEQLMHLTASGIPANVVGDRMGRSVKSIRGRIAYLRDKDAVSDA